MCNWNFGYDLVTIVGNLVAKSKKIVSLHPVGCNSAAEVLK